MTELLVRGARLAGRDGRYDIAADGGQTISVVPADTVRGGNDTTDGAETVIESYGALVSPPYVAPHVHLDAALTAGEPRWNASGRCCAGTRPAACCTYGPTRTSPTRS